ncbi:hypothetical protein OOJ91_12295 [Micromonospora lupini]|uniref:hypothetical protein n=1 Tax=Micromonospora lupini TaxID=285679 RepID=UPI00225A76A3|nr:hypothetical protein [Micromonospora lupini]MCX5066659.1 hypothetical protein [Micromonospora lupini]
MNGWEIAASFVFGLLVNEMTDLSPWAARRLVRWAAYRWTTDPDIAAGYAEEWTAIVEERPGKLLKLLTAAQFSLGAAGRALPRVWAAVGDSATRVVADGLDIPMRPARELLPVFAVGLLTTGITGFVSGAGQGALAQAIPVAIAVPIWSGVTYLALRAVHRSERERYRGRMALLWRSETPPDPR